MEEQVCWMKLSSVMKIQVYWTGLSLVMGRGYNILTLNAREKAWSGSFLVHHKRSSEVFPVLKKNLANLLVGYEGAYFGTS